MNQAIQVIEAAKDQFLSIVNDSPESALVWKSEANFAMQAVNKNDRAIAAFQSNPQSLRDSVINVASVGLSLNPAYDYAYLVPRDNQICLDIGYQGLIKIATDTGSILWAKAEVVYSNDQFDYNGPAQLPTHIADPFSSDRGDIVGVYCIAKTLDGDYLIETMPESEIINIKNKSPSARSSYSPWNTFPNEMRKKAVIKRASKTWPKTDRKDRLSKVIDYVNQEEGIDIDQSYSEDLKKVNDLIHAKNGAALANLLDGDACVTSYWAKLIKSLAPKGQIGKHKAMIESWRKEAIDYVNSVSVRILETDDEIDIAECYGELNQEERTLFWKVLSPESKIDIENKINSLTANDSLNVA